MVSFLLIVFSSEIIFENELAADTRKCRAPVDFGTGKKIFGERLLFAGTRS